MKIVEFLGRKKEWVLLLAVCVTLSLQAQTEAANAVRGEYIVQLRNAETPEAISNMLPSLRVVKPLSRHMNIWLMKSDPSQDLLPELKRNNAVRVAQSNHRVQSRALTIPNDPRFSEQWNMRNTGAANGVYGADISATSAWALNTSNLTKNGDTIVVAVIDNTFDQSHEDLNYFYNYHEIPNNGIDDDGNGFIDDFHGWNVFDNNDSVFVFPSSHSTHIAGIIGAIQNNNKGVSGVCPGVKILAISGSSEKESEVVEAYDYVLEMRKLYQQTAGAKGAFVVATNTSFGVGNYGAHPADFPIWCAMYDSLGKYGILSAVAGPNSGVNIDVVDDVPSACPSRFAISVTNTTRFDRRHISAGYGSLNMDLGAPGTQVLSSIPGNNYGLLTGTSMATPHVAGALAAMYAAACQQFINNYDNFPDSFALQMRAYLLAGVDTFPWLDTLATKGRLNLFKAVANVLSYNCNHCNFNTATTAIGARCTGEGNGMAIVTTTGSGPFTYQWNNGAATSIDTPLAPGAYWVTITQSGSSCTQIRAAEVTDPAPLHIDSIRVIPIKNGIDGNFVVTAAAGNDVLEYAIDNQAFQQNKIFVVNTAGPHHLLVRSPSGCTIDTVVNMRDVTGIETISGKAFFAAPVPANNQLQLFFEENLSGTITVFDMQGRQVWQQSISNEKEIQLNTTALLNGIYLLRFEEKNSKNSTIRISIAHE